MWEFCKTAGALAAKSVLAPALELASTAVLGGSKEMEAEGGRRGAVVGGGGEGGRRRRGGGAGGKREGEEECRVGGRWRWG